MQNHSGPHTRNEGITILLVEDDSSVRRLVSQTADCIKAHLEAPEAEASEAAHPGAELAPEAGGGGAAASRPAPAVAPPQAAKPVNALSLFFSVLWDRIKRLFGGGRSA